MVNCKICGSKDTTLYHTFPFFPVIACKSCGTLFAKHPPKEERLDEIYSDSYYEGWKGVDKKLTEKTRNMKIYTFSYYLKLLKRNTKLKGKKLLDIGCATGYLLEAAKKEGADCYGVEVSPYGAQEANKKFPGRIFCGILEEAKYQDNYFDIITMTDLIEHVLDPVFFLKEVNRILKPEGYILIITPNFHSWWSKILGKKWTNFKEEHLFYFSPTSLKFLMKKSDFKIIYEKAVSKYLNLDYIYSQFTVFPTPGLYHISRTFPLIPSVLRTKNFPIGTGDYLILAKKKTPTSI